jgi:hypothetical protein
MTASRIINVYGNCIAILNTAPLDNWIRLFCDVPPVFGAFSVGLCSKLDVLTSVADPVLFLPLDPGSGMEKIQIQDPRSGMNILDLLIIVNLLAVLWLKIL